MDEFGYTPEPALEVVSVQVGEGKAAGSLQPRVVIAFRAELEGEQHTVAISPDLAEGLASELTRWAQRAREKHWE